MWRAVWQTVDAFLDRIDSALGNDKPYAQTMCALLKVFGVIERARWRSSGYGLADAVPAAVQGVGMGSVSDLAGASGRIPGTEECEFACAPYAVKTTDDGTIEFDDPPHIILQRTITLAKFRDLKHGEVTLKTPTYEVGHLELGGVPWKAIDIGDGGLFDDDQRDDATNGNAKDGDGNPVPANFTRWSKLRHDRITAIAEPEDDDDKPLPLSEQVANWTSSTEASKVTEAANKAHGYAAQARSDINVLNNAKKELTDAGVNDDVLGAIAAAVQAMGNQAANYDKAYAAMAGHGLPYGQTRLDWIVLLQKAEGTTADSGLPTPIDKLDKAAIHGMDEAVENRIGYPDGPLRQLRMLQWTLRFFWDHRRGWMNWRHLRMLSPLYYAYMANFTDSLHRVLVGQTSGIVYPGNDQGAAGIPLPGNTKVGKQILVGATEIPLSSAPDLSLLQAGRIAIILGDRPTAGIAVAGLVDWRKMPPIRLKVPPLAVSVETGAKLPGTPGLIPVATPITDHYRPLTHDELLRGAHEPGIPGDGKPARAKDGIVQSLIAHRSRLALVLGENGGSDRPAPPAMVRPYATVSTFPLEGKVTAQDNRLFLKTLPPTSKSGTGEQLPLAAPGELLLLTGKDVDGETWQTAIEVDRVVVVTGAEAKRDDGTGATPTPTCCTDDERVMVVYLRSCYLPGDITELHGAYLHRNFLGFGPRSLLTRVMLPAELDPTTVVASARRDPELEVAWRVLDDWLPKEPK
jgi:hypothetical protein